MSPEHWSRFKAGDTFILSDRIGQRADRILRPEETAYVLGDEPGVYFSSRRRPPAGVFFFEALTGGPLAGDLTSQVIADLAQGRPDLLIIHTTSASRLPREHQLIRWLTQHYCPIDANPRGGLFEACPRRGSDLERRLGSAGERSSTPAAWKRALYD